MPEKVDEFPRDEILSIVSNAVYTRKILKLSKLTDLTVLALTQEDVLTPIRLILHEFLCLFYVCII